MQVFDLSQIKAAIDFESLIQNQEQGFVAFSNGRVVVPPVGYLGFPAVSGDCHIKYGYIQGDDYFVIKIATGFYQNSSHGLPVGGGMMAVFGQKTGGLEAVLLEEGYLTDIRTAAAGAVVAKYLAPKKLNRIGIVGTGVQARLQLQMLKYVTDCRDVLIWGRKPENQEKFAEEMSANGFSVNPVSELKDLTSTCNLIVTTTPSRQPLIMAEQVRPGTHITAVGADAEGKQELDPDIFAKADIVVVDSRAQCIDHGDTSYAAKAGTIDATKPLEIGEVILDPTLTRTNDQQITVADLTGVAVQDIQIAVMLYKSLMLRALPKAARIFRGRVEG